MALNVRNKLGFIDGTIPKPPDDDRNAGSWSRCNDMVATWIMNSVEKKIAQSLLYMSTAESIWKNLLARFKQDDAPRVYEIEQRLGSIQQGSMDVTAYYTELVTLWEEHKNFVDLPVCTCGKCECNAAKSWETLQERSRVTKFLMGLNEAYDSTRRQILMIKPLPSIEDVFNMITQDERQKAIKPSTKTDSVVFQTTGSDLSAEPFDNPVLPLNINMDIVLSSVLCVHIVDNMVTLSRSVSKSMAILQVIDFMDRQTKDILSSSLHVVRIMVVILVSRNSSIKFHKRMQWLMLRVHLCLLLLLHQRLVPLT